MDDLAQLLAPPPDQGRDPEVRLGKGKVTAVTATTATIDWAGGTGYIARYHTHTTLTVNDVVSVLYGGGALLVLGKIR